MEASAVPRVEPGPPEVLDVRLTVDAPTWPTPRLLLRGQV